MRIMFADLGDWDYTIDTPRHLPLGGSHSAACYLAEALAALGHEILFLNKTTSPATIRGVRCISRLDTPIHAIRATDPQLVVSLLSGDSGQTLRLVFGPRPKLILWTQHAHTQEAVQPLLDPAHRNAYDAFAFVSHWQQHEFHRSFGIDLARTTVIGNGVSPSSMHLFPADHPILPAKPRPPILAYTSIPYRGLPILLDVFPYLRQVCPGLRLRVFSSMQVYQVPPANDQHAPLYDRCRQTPGVEYIGSIPQPQLAAALRECSILAYPNVYPETFCISAIEAMAAGCLVVSSALGALPETTAGFAHLIPIRENDPTYHQRFFDAMVQALNSLDRPHETEPLLRRQLDHIHRECTWPHLATQWAAWLQSLL